MKSPFEADDIAKTAANDTGFQKVLSSLSKADAAQIQDIISDPSYLTNILQLLPESSRTQTLNVISDIFNAPDKALRLYKQCRFFEARDLLNKTIDIFAQAPETMFPGLDTTVKFVTKRVQALCHDLLARVEWELGNSDRSYAQHRLAYNLAEEIDDDDTIAKALLGMGTFHWHQGDIQKGEEYLLNALEQLAGPDDQWTTKNKILTSLSVLYGDIGEFETALDFGGQAVELAEASGDYRSLPNCLNNLACLQAKYGGYEEATANLEEGLEIVQAHQDSSLEALLLNNLAILSIRQSSSSKTISKASFWLEKALAIGRSTKSLNTQAMTLNYMGVFHEHVGSRDKARESFQEALSIYYHLGSRANEARVLASLGKLLREQFHDNEGSCEHLRKAVALVEKTRGSLLKETHRISYADREIEPYELLIENLLHLGRTSEALEYVERAKSRALVDFLSERLRNYGVEDTSREYKQAAELLIEIEEIQANLEKIVSKGTNNSNEEDAPSRYQDVTYPLIQELMAKERMFHDSWASLTKVNPEKSSLLKVQTLSCEEIQSQLDEETLFLEFFQGYEQLHLFAIKNTGEIKEVRVTLTIEEARETLHPLLTALSREKGRNIRTHEYIKEIRKPLTRLFDLLFIPFRQEINESKRLIISPHLFWHYLPFHALYDQQQKNYLCDQIEIGCTPSASILALCKRKKRTNREKALILCRNNGDLPHVDQEGDLLAGAFYPHGHLYQGDDAHLGHLESNTNSYDVVHFACHGRYVPEQPFLSGINMPPEPYSQRQTYLFDFFNKHLDCSLVTLSACESGLTNYTNGDELIGLSRALFAAGAAAAMVSLWQVADSSTCYFMENFYYHYVKNQQTKTRAIQLAMQAVKAKEAYAHPYFWAPFVIMGDWR